MIKAGYETTYVLKTDVTDEAAKALQDRLISQIGTFDGEAVLVEDWGRKKLAYNIQKESRGRYVYLAYTGRGDVAGEVERNLRLQDTVLRFLTVNLGKEFDPEQYKTKRAEMQAAARKRQEEREARIRERNQERRSNEEFYGDAGGSEE